jgi:hypothetical protein
MNGDLFYTTHSNGRTFRTSLKSGGPIPFVSLTDKNLHAQNVLLHELAREIVEHSVYLECQK